MNEQNVAGRKKGTKIRFRISDLMDASAPEYDMEVLTLHHYVQRNQSVSACFICNRTA
jgi:hypothetical protein